MYVDAGWGPPAKRWSRVRRRTVLAGGLGALAALGGASVWGLDRYVIDHVEVANASARKAQKAVVASAATTGTWTATTYTSETADISVSTVKRGSGSDKIVAFVAEVKTTDATILRSAFAKDSYGRNIVESTSGIAARMKAVLAINGDYHGFRDDGIIIRNGVTYRDKPTRQGLACYTDGTVDIYDETSTTARKLIDAGVWNTMSFGPGLVINGQIPSGIDTYEIGDIKDARPGAFGSIQGNQPRTGLGFIEPNHFVLIVVDGRGANGSRGAAMTEFATMFVEAGAKTAYNLDGGGSSTMVFHNGVVNEPGVHGQQRGTSDILFVAG